MQNDHLIMGVCACVVNQVTVEKFHCFASNCTTAAMEELLGHVKKHRSWQQQVDLEKYKKIILLFFDR